MVQITAPRQDNDETHPNDVLSASLCRKHTQDSRPTSNIEDGFPLKQVTIVYNGRTVRSRANRVLQHLLVNT